MTLFPEGFLWGAASSACQIEGGAGEGGRGDSIWDRFARRPGRVADGATPAVACDHYHRYRDDVALMARLGLGAYRFSIAWPRVYPRGYGAVNRPGLDFYDSLTDALLEQGITPLATLYHWDLPQGLQRRGGWPERDTARYFADFAEQVARRLGDRITLWITLNEPQVAAHLGHEHGVHAPGTRGLAGALQAAHHLLLAHGLAVEVLRDLVPRARLGIALNLAPVHPAGDSAADADAASRADGYVNRWYLDPLLRGAYPADLQDAYRELEILPEVAEGDAEVIAAPLDFLGVNYYFRWVVAAGAGATAGKGTAASGTGGTAGRRAAGSGTAAPGTAAGVRGTTPGADSTAAGTAAPGTGAAPDRGTPAQGGPRQRELGFRVTNVSSGQQEGFTAMGWEMYPAGLSELLLRLHREYAPAALYVTENGAAYEDTPAADGSVDDGDRERYLRVHLEAVHEALAAGAPVGGYFAWSLLDNFEWTHGYRKRFGLVRVDFDSQRRTPKRSALWYRDVIAQGGLP